MLYRLRNKYNKYIIRCITINPFFLIAVHFPESFSEINNRNGKIKHL